MRNLHSQLSGIFQQVKWKYLPLPPLILNEGVTWLMSIKIPHVRLVFENSYIFIDLEDLYSVLN